MTLHHRNRSDRSVVFATSVSLQRSHPALNFDRLFDAALIRTQFMNPRYASVSILLVMPLMAGSVRVYQTNSAGDEVDVIDPATNKIVQTVKDIEVPHGVGFSPDGTRAWISCEAEKTVWVVDTKTAHLIQKIPLSGHPNNLAVSRDGKRVFVAILESPGAVDVIDTGSLTNIKSIPVKGPVHNTYVTPDGKYAIAGSIVGKMLTVIDEQTLEPVWESCLSIWACVPWHLRRRLTDRPAGCLFSFPASTASQSWISGLTRKLHASNCRPRLMAVRPKVARLRTESASLPTARPCGLTVHTRQCVYFPALFSCRI